jgi:hypothetical protein
MPRIRILRALVAGCSDSIGTVRAASQKALGESIVVGSLVSFPGDPAQITEGGGGSGEASGGAMVRDDSTTQQQSIIEYSLAALLKGCTDSKLTVRVQGALALSNLLLLMLPARQRCNNVILDTKSAHDYAAIVDAHTHRGSDAAAMASNSLDLASMTTNALARCEKWVRDESWLRMCTLSLSLVADSEKVLASAVRCLGFLSAGLSPWQPQQVAVLEQITDTLVDKILLSGEKIKRAVAAGLIADTTAQGAYVVHAIPTDSSMHAST